ncbi:hypothetical protein ROE7235_03520 [Roseibaca ekhonensis]|uniref:Putative DNA-binding domain-containing protein n=1 Tax=Roseinatronobacter ekhonensis TaxID=254356 RepID=A0A3B0N126_9RHOB|nr:putative DNA-binding domain-containing protein [Roseibaca ekhonensis]SUZ33746.1 hypothetical protein ROE7235_03520 [Roseibaca ekhonensis]
MPHERSSHAETEHAFHAALWGSEPPDGVTALDSTEVSQRFKVYRNNVQHSLTRALAARFPVIEQLVGKDFFTAMARVFIANNPPRDPVMLRWGGEFAAFLASFPPVSNMPYLADVARLEYARGQACHAADADPVAPDALNVDDLEALKVSLHPSVSLFHAQYPALQIWQAHQPDTARKPIAAGPDYALIARQPDFTVIVEALDPDTYAVLCDLRDGKLLGQAARKADPTTALALLLRHGLIIDTGIGAPA